MKFGKQLQELSPAEQKRTVSNRRGITAAIAGLGVAASLAIPATINAHKPSIEKTAKIVSLSEPNSPIKPLLKVEVKAGGSISDAVSVIAKAEGDPDNNATYQGINNDFHAIADQISAVPGGDVDAGTTFYVHPEQPIINIEALKSDPTETITELK